MGAHVADEVARELPQARTRVRYVEELEAEIRRRAGIPDLEYTTSVSESLVDSEEEASLPQPQVRPTTQPQPRQGLNEAGG